MIDWILVLCALEIACGLTLLYFRFCLYETEEGKLANKVIALWVHVDDRAKMIRGRTEQLLQRTLAITLAFFARTFGSKLISWHALSVSSLSAFALVVLSAWDWDTVLDSEFTIASIALAAAAMPAIFNRLWARVVTYVVVVLFTAGFAALWSYVLVIDPDMDDGARQLVIVVFAAIVLDFAWLAFNRAALQWCVRRSVVFRTVLVMLVCASLAIATYVAESSVDWFTARPYDEGLFYGTLHALLATRLFIAAVSLLQAMVLVAVLANLVTWPLISRFVYALDRYDVIRERKFFGRIGMTLIGQAAAALGWKLY